MKSKINMLRIDESLEIIDDIFNKKVMDQRKKLTLADVARFVRATADIQAECLRVRGR